jgi:DNA-binding CsgD family transcriptional regulator
VAVAYALSSALDRGRAEHELDDLVALGETLDSDQLPRSQVLVAQGRVFAERGRHEQALERFLACDLDDPGWGRDCASLVPWRSGAALAMASLGSEAEARKLAADELAVARAYGTPRALGMALRAAGLVEGGSRGLCLLREAVDVLENGQSPLELARAQTDLGAALRRANQRREGREHLRRGLDLAERCGASAIKRRAVDELAAAGARPRRALLSGLDSLTASELRVARMAADGMRNKDIAQSLYVTTKTVETHLRHCFQKLDVASRDELEKALDESG